MKWKKRRLSLLALCLALALLPAMSVPALAVPGGSDQPTLTVGGTDVISGGYWKTDTTAGTLASCIGGDNWNVHYDKSNSTLTLKNATIKGQSSQTYGAGIYAAVKDGGETDFDLTIVVLDEESIVDGVVGSSGRSYGIYVYGNLTIQGSGSLIAQSATVTEESFGIRASKNIKIGDVNSGVPTVIALAGSANASRGIFISTRNQTVTINKAVVTATGSSNGVYTTNNLVLENGGILTASSIVCFESPLTPTGIGITVVGTDTKMGTVYGSPTLPASYTLPDNTTLTVGSGQTLTIPSGTTLTVPSGATLTNNGEIKLEGGTLDVKGTLDGSGTITGSGTVNRSIPAPTATSGNITATSVTLDAVAPTVSAGSGDTVLYAKSGTNEAPTNSDAWQSSTTFEDLTSNTTYYFFAKVEEANSSGSKFSKAVSSGKEVKTAAAPETGTASLTVNSIDFGAVTTGYTQPAAAEVTVTNTGTADATVTGVSLSGSGSDKFALNVITTTDGVLDPITIHPAEKQVVATIQPVTSIPVGSYRPTIVVAYGDGQTVTAPVSITVAPAYGYGDSDDDDDDDPVNYTLTFQTGGGSALSPITRSEGTVIDLGSHVPTRAGYAFEGWYADEELTERVESVTLRRDTTVYAKWRFLNPFTDVKTGDFCYEGALWAVENGITLGTTASTFSPDEVCTRAQIITMLWRAKGSPEPGGHPSPFSDVGENEEDEYYYKAVLWAWQNGIAGGYGNNMFGPDEPCTRAEALTFLWRVVGSPRPAANAPFTDLEPRAYYTYAVGWGYENGIVNGTGNGLFDPGGVCTRGQIVTMLWRAMG